jgi:hypothetical protein
MSEQKTAKVAEIVKTRKWDNPKGGTVYYSTLKMDNGDFGEIGKKTENAIRIGDELNYTLEPNGDYAAKIKPVFNNSGFGGGGFGGRSKQGSSASFALSYAKDLMIASMPFHQDVSVSQWVDVTVTTATKFQNWLKENE